MKYELPQEELIYSGHIACHGCAAVLAMRYSLQALGKRTIVVIPACCWSILASPFPSTTLKVPVLNTLFMAGAVTAAGVKSGLRARGIEDVTVMAWAGDGGTHDIGIQSLSGCAERSDDIIYACYDNEAYMNTGIQRSSATPYLGWTTTTPSPALKETPKKDIMAIMAAHAIPYAATVSVGFPEDFLAKMRKAKEIKGFRFIHILSSCPPGWKFPSELSVKMARLSVETKVFPLYEVENGKKYRITYNPKGLPVSDYLRLQGRFSHLTDKNMEVIQANVDEGWESLMAKAKASARKTRGPKKSNRKEAASQASSST